jgi:hypothetical protein
MTRNDILNGNSDLIEHAAGVLAGLPVYRLTARIVSRTPQTALIEIETLNAYWLDGYVNRRPLLSVAIQDGIRQIEVPLPKKPAVTLLLESFKGEQLVAARRLAL